MLFARSDQLVKSEVISKVFFTSEQRRARDFKIFRTFVGLLSKPVCVVYIKTIIHLCVGECGGYLPSRFDSVNNFLLGRAGKAVLNAFFFC